MAAPSGTLPRSSTRSASFRLSNSIRLPRRPLPQLQLNAAFVLAENLEAMHQVRGTVGSARAANTAAPRRTSSGLCRTRPQHQGRRHCEPRPRSGAGRPCSRRTFPPAPGDPRTRPPFAKRRRARPEPGCSPSAAARRAGRRSGSRSSVSPTGARRARRTARPGEWRRRLRAGDHAGGNERGPEGDNRRAKRGHICLDGRQLGDERGNVGLVRIDRGDGRIAVRGRVPPPAAAPVPPAGRPRPSAPAGAEEVSAAGAAMVA